MQCPTDGATLVMSERSGIEIDYCPQCRGVWLDRGELDKIIERSLQQPAYGTPTPVQDQPVQGHRTLPPQPEHGRDPRAGYAPDRRYQAYSAPSAPSPEDAWRRGGHGDDRRPRRRRESWLSDLFD
ncbi:zf-TFIIB domain-containing protein [Pseudactinotalea terrae]|uniref:TFIIB-type zinc ribbon-containing protein n=1 Tax=Pseudactinotalea terrae TaxID=1743262 RepID=UPI0012E0EF2D|nr:zf-TFIIB domain-containing protein [Pseudactinotalea terrae]